MLLTMLGSVFGGLFSIGEKWVEKKTVEAEGKIEIAKAETRGRVAAAERADDYDVAAVKGMAASWKDEYLVLVLSGPFIGSFIPGVQDSVNLGWDYLAKAPEFYMWAFLGVISATFGLRWTQKFFNK